MRPRVLAIALLAVVATAILIPHGLENRHDFFVSAIVGLAAFLPVAALGASNIYRRAAFIWVAAVAILGFFILPLTAASLIGLLVGTAFAPGSRRSTAMLLGSAAIIGVTAIAIYGFALAPTPPASAFVCIDTSGDASVDATIAAFGTVSEDIGNGEADLWPGIDSIGTTTYGVRVDFMATATEQEATAVVRALRSSSAGVTDVLRRERC